MFVGPGAKIGDGAVVGANSFVNRVIPSKCLATGSPARVVGQAPYFPRKLRDGDRETILRDILAEMVEYLRASELDCRHEGDEIEVTWKRNGWFSRQSSEKIRVVTELLDKPSLPSLNDRTTVFLSLRNIPLDFRRQLVARDILWFDIERKERSACSHDLGKKWRYTCAATAFDSPACLVRQSTDERAAESLCVIFEPNHECLSAGNQKLYC